MRKLWRTGAVLVLAVAALGAAGCVSEPASVVTVPGLFPAFSRDITDYVDRCDPSTPVRVDVSATEGTTVSVDGSAPQGGQFTASVAQQVGRRFVITVTKDGITTSHSVRCLPPDFPTFEVTRTGTPQAEFYATLPFAFPNPGAYPVILDDHGVPIWWGTKTNGLYATVLPDGNPAWVANDLFEEHTFNGAPVRTYGSVGQLTDFHELAFLANGNHVLASDTPRPHVDLRSWGGPSDATILDHVIQEIDPNGQVVWSWDTADHISVDQTMPFFRSAELADPGGPFSDFYDAYHLNAITPDGDGYVVSFRHLDALFKINRTTGAIEWKLGGTLRTESLAYVGDPVADQGGAFGGQHDVRVLSDGTLTLFDNGTDRNRPPRALAYRIDLSQRRAILLSQITDPEVGYSNCCGANRILAPRGDVVITWGGNVDPAPDFTETTPSGQRVIAVRFPGANLYRVTPIPFNTLARETLRQGMDVRYGVQP